MLRCVIKSMMMMMMIMKIIRVINKIPGLKLSQLLTGVLQKTSIQ